MPDIKHLIEIKASPETVFALVSTPDGLSKWWAEDVFDATKDACSLGFFNRDTVYRLKSETVQAPSRMVWKNETGAEWEGTRIVFDVERRGKGTMLRFAHAGWKAETDYFTSCNTTWGELMYRLMAVAQGEKVGPLFKKSSLGY